MQIFRKTDISYPLIHTHRCAYKEVRNVSFSKKFANVLNEWSLIKESNDLRLLLLPLTYFKPIPISTPLEVIRKLTVFWRYVIIHWLKMSYCSLWTWCSFWAWLYFAFMKLIFKVSLEGCFKTIWKLHYSFPNLIWSFSIPNPNYGYLNQMDYRRSILLKNLSF